MADPTNDGVVRAACDALAGEGAVGLLVDDPAATRDWLDWELASLVEGHFHTVLDPRGLSPAERVNWELRVTGGREKLTSPHDAYRTPCWILDGAERVGTIAFGKHFSGGFLVPISSLYIHPARRKQGAARRALDGAFRALTAQQVHGIRVGTSWTWQSAVRFYAYLGMWVRGWKHELTYVRSQDLPDYRVEYAADLARFLVLDEDRWIPLLEAGRDGERLAWTELAPNVSRDPFHEACVLAPGTFAVHLALQGWPLIRSTNQWAQRHRWSDLGEPEGLAYKIEVFEAVDRKKGYDVRTPRIPGLVYRDLDAID